MIDLIEDGTFVRWPKTHLLNNRVRGHCRRLGRKEVKGESPYNRWIKKEREYSKWFNNRFAIGPDVQFGFVSSIRFHYLPELQPFAAINNT